MIYAFALRENWSYLFGGKSGGLDNQGLFEALLSTQSPLIPRLSWALSVGGHWGIGAAACLSTAWALLLGSGCLLIMGLFFRPAAIVAWLLHLAAAKSGGLLSYGADNFITIGLFYLMIAPLPDRFSLDWAIRRRSIADPSLLGFHRHVLQLHLCLIYFFSGLTKCLGRGWWDGSNIWRALTLPPFDVLPIGLVASWKPILPMLGISVCLVEMGYAFLIWPPWSRRWILGAVCVMHAGIGLAMGMYLFALIMIVLNLAAFATSQTAPDVDLGDVTTGGKATQQER
ncbi:MAG: hypothetical protein M3Q46_09555 [Verrucomicrobiota bacterium]|nr:hypothetical protein [Verrucomicrobiota bacterium]